MGRQDMNGLDGLYTLIRAGFLALVQIVRNIKPLYETHSAYHGYDGLSRQSHIVRRRPKGAAVYKEIPIIPIGRYKTISSGYKGLGMFGHKWFDGLKIKRFDGFFYFSNIHPVIV
jgi:hypothetical protein